MKTKILLGVAAVLLLAYKPWIMVLGVACVICVSTLLAGLFMLGMRIAERHDPVQQLIKRDRRNKEWTKRN